MLRHSYKKEKKKKSNWQDRKVKTEENSIDFVNTAAESSGRGRKATFKGIIPIEKLKFKHIFNCDNGMENEIYSNKFLL